MPRRPRVRPPISQVNPFINLTMHLPWYQYVKMVLVGVTLLPFRILFTIVNVFIMWCFATLILAGLSGKRFPSSQCPASFRVYT